LQLLSFINQININLQLQQPLFNAKRQELHIFDESCSLRGGSFFYSHSALLLAEFCISDCFVAVFNNAAHKPLIP